MKKLTIQNISKCGNCSSLKKRKEQLNKLLEEYGMGDLILNPTKIDYEKFEISKSVSSIIEPFILEVKYELPHNRKVCEELKEQLEIRIFCKLHNLVHVFIGGVIAKIEFDIEEGKKENSPQKEGEEECVKQKKI